MFVTFSHTNYSNTSLLRLSKLQLNSVACRAKQWVLTGKHPEVEIAEKVLLQSENISKLLDIVDDNEKCCPSTTAPVSDTDVTPTTHYYAHNNCYLRFASLSKLERAQGSKRKVS